VETAAVVEIDMMAFGDFFLMIFTTCLESKERFPQSPQRRRRWLLPKTQGQETQHFFYSQTTL